jgi:hypothetical protein
MTSTGVLLNSVGRGAFVLAAAFAAVLAIGAIQPAHAASASARATGGVKSTTPVEITQTFAIPLMSPTGTQQVEVAMACTDVLRNGGFETSPARPWTGVANTSSVVYNDPLVSTARTHSGGWSGRVGSPTVNSYWNELLQTVQLPAGVASVTLRYWRYLATTETSRTRAYDIFTVGLETEQGIQIVTPQRIDNTSSGRAAWVSSSLALPNAPAYSGQRLWVSFKGRTDSNLPSSLYVDDTQLIVCATR